MTHTLLSKVLFRVPQGSILGTLLSNICICDLFFFVSDSNVENYVDENTLYSARKRLIRTV